MEHGKLFGSVEEFKRVVVEYSIAHRKDIKMPCNEKWRVRAKCKAPYKWFVFAIRHGVDKGTTLQVKSLNTKHTNCRSPCHNRHANSTWLSHKYEGMFGANVDMPWQAIRETVKKNAPL